MNKYEPPVIEIDALDASDIITASGDSAVRIDKLEGFDEGESKSAIFDASFWINLVK